jgi:hypothetical protein
VLGSRFVFKFGSRFAVLRSRFGVRGSEFVDSRNLERRTLNREPRTELEHELRRENREA